MKIVVSSMGHELESQVSPNFGRCPVFAFIDLETLALEAIDNPAANAAGGAGIQAARFVIDHGSQAVVTGRVGPNAMEVFQTSDFPVYLFEGGTVRAAAEAFKAGSLQRATASQGFGGGRGMGRGRRRG
jgi:predicted Fe-Mo cluster-binding NifX family protein